jgi:pimeloyl-ACP methyl ester carboxylesterase
MRWAAVCAIISVCAIAWMVIDRAQYGTPNFRIWRMISGEAHGGQRVRLNGVQIYYETFGSGPPVLVLHGGKGRLETMHYQIAALASDHLVVAPDSRGHGRSTDGPGPLHYDDMAADMIGLMDRLHLAKADVVGWSDGGIVGLDMAMRRPDRVSRLVVVGANYDVSGLRESADPPAGRLDPLAGFRAVYQRLQRLGAPGQRARDERVLRLWRTEPHFSLAELARIRCPVLVVAGENDVVRREHTDSLALAIPGAREVIVRGADHMAPLRSPRQINAEIRSFLAGG